MIATALLFSGRPNPQWQVDPATVARLVALLTKLAPAKAGVAAAPPGLGYGGIELRFAAGGDEHVLVFTGGLASGTSGTFIDPDGVIENLLVQSARNHLPASDYRALIACR